MSEIEVDQSSSIYCNDCNILIAVNEINGKRVPCPVCGSTKRNFKDEIIVYHTVKGGIINGDEDKCKPI